MPFYSRFVEKIRKSALWRWFDQHHRALTSSLTLGVGLLCAIAVVLAWQYSLARQQHQTVEAGFREQLGILTGLSDSRNQEIARLQTELASSSAQVASLSASYAELYAEDQVRTNRELKQELTTLKQTFRSSLNTYEDLVDLTQAGTNTKTHTADFAKALTYLSQENWASASATLSKLQTNLNSLKAAGSAVALSAVSAQTPPDSGYRRQSVTTSDGAFIVDIYSASLSSARVIVDTASDGDCSDNCPVLSVGTYAARNGALAAVNGSYFCPASYPSCVGKANSFDTLLMNKNKVYFNSANNVYSTVPAAIFGSGYARFIGQSLEWGRDTGVDAVIANRPLLVQNGELRVSADPDPKMVSRGNRSFVAESDGRVFIGVVRNVSVAQSARVLHAMGIKNALNLDSGGSTAFWAGGYKVGPGRDVPNAVVIVRR